MMNNKNHLHLVNTATETISNATGNAKTIVDNLKYIENALSGFKFKNVAVVLISASIGISIEANTEAISKYILQQNRDSYSELKPFLDKCESDLKGKCLLRVQTEHNLYQSEYLANFLASTEQEKELIASKTPDIIDRAVLYENKVLKQTENNSNENLNQNAPSEPLVNPNRDNEMARTEQKLNY